MSTSIQGGPSLPQERKLVTAIPGPKSQEILARKNAAVASGVGVALPVSIVAAGGGVKLCGLCGADSLPSLAAACSSTLTATR